MPRRLHPFACLQNCPVVSANSRDGMIYKISNDIVFKAPFAWTGATEALLEEHLESVNSVDREKMVYELLRPHRPPHIISMIVSAPEGIFLQLANGGTLKQRLKLSKERHVQWMEKLRWIKGIIEGEMALADLGLLHGDLNLDNILLHDGQVKLCDLCATVPKDSSLVAPLFPRFSIPIAGGDLNMIATEQSEIFAIGTCIYEIMSEHLPYPAMKEWEVALHFKRGQFPSTDHSSLEPIGAVVDRCWTGQYGSLGSLRNNFSIVCSSAGVFQSLEVEVEEEDEILNILEAQCKQFLEDARKRAV